MNQRRFDVQFFVAGALGMHKKNKEYKVSLRIAEKEWTSQAP